MFKVAVANYEAEKYENLAGEFSYAADILKAYPMLGWIGEIEMDNIMHDVLFDTVINGENLNSIYEKYSQNGISPYFNDESFKNGYLKVADAKFFPTEEQLAEMRKYDTIGLIYDAE
jgi:hypothetical protein